jgi:NAD(P)-dependent dehydrogenase (short-subunit alcohol dehydrogenase family)
MPTPGSGSDGRRVLLLTGAAGTLGTAFCRAHAADYDIVAVRHQTALRVTTDRQRFVDPLAPAADLERNAHPVFEVQADLTRTADIERVVEVALAHHGRIDVVVNAVGTAAPAPLLGRGLQQMDHAMRLNATAPLELAVRVADVHWRHLDDGRTANRCVVNVSSAAAVDVGDGRGAPPFAASKAALNMLTAHLAVELEPFGVRAATIAPAPFPDPIDTSRVVDGIRTLVDGDATGRVLLVWEDADELV